MSGPEDANELKSFEARLANLRAARGPTGPRAIDVSHGAGVGTRGERTLPRRGEFRAT